jgi:hypothetical protein
MKINIDLMTQEGRRNGKWKPKGLYKNFFFAVVWEFFAKDIGALNLIILVFQITNETFVRTDHLDGTIAFTGRGRYDDISRYKSWVTSTSDKLHFRWI